MEIFPLSPPGFEPNCTALNAWDTRQKDGQKNRTECLWESHTNAQAVPPGIQEDIAMAAGRGLCAGGSTRDIPKARSQPTLHPGTGRSAQLCRVGSGHDGWDGMGWRPQCQPHCTGSTHGSGRRERSRHWQCWLPRDVSAAQCLSSRLFIFTGKNRK